MPFVFLPILLPLINSYFACLFKGKTSNILTQPKRCLRMNRRKMDVWLWRPETTFTYKLSIIPVGGADPARGRQVYIELIDR